jgi:hypothetical protein
VEAALGELEQTGRAGRELRRVFRYRDAQLIRQALPTAWDPYFSCGIRFGMEVILEPGSSSGGSTNCTSLITLWVTGYPDPKPEDVIPFGHEIQHVAQGWPWCCSVQGEVLAYIVEGALDDGLGVVPNDRVDYVWGRHYDQQGNLVDPVDPYSDEDLQRFYNYSPHSCVCPNLKSDGGVPSGWLDKYGITWPPN